MTEVFLLWHSHDIAGGETDDKLIGVYVTQGDAEAAIQRLSDKPGFRDVPNGFLVDPYTLNRDHWPDGYITVP